MKRLLSLDDVHRIGSSLGMLAGPPSVSGAGLLVPHPTAHSQWMTVSRRSHPELLGVPGGKLETLEDTLSAALREFHEETGFPSPDRSSVVHLITAPVDNQWKPTTLFTVYMAGIQAVNAMGLTSATDLSEVSSEEGVVVSWASTAELCRDPEDACEGERSSPFFLFNRVMFAALDVYARSLPWD